MQGRTAVRPCAIRQSKGREGQSMGTYKGNVGHLMQHWTLCELLRIAGKHTPGLDFIDAHAMAPWATRRTVPVDPRFDHVQGRLVNQPESTYERAWHTLRQNNQQRGEGYPNSAALVSEVWKGDFSLLLCEIDCTTIREIDCWLPSVRRLERCKRARRFHGDWRMRFAAGLASPSADGLSDEALTLVSFDPNMYIRRWGIRVTGGIRTNRGNLYPEDLQRALCAMRGLGSSRILIQLSTYSSRSSGNQHLIGKDVSNRQEDVKRSVDEIMTEHCFTRSALARVGDKMMSLVYARNVPWSAELADLPDRFNDWLRGTLVSQA